ncbi:hypothetical protein [Microbulbifer celer]|uniref:Uncharacterized protein n=1 Tax=Microbulbifer celer TaxID=435905 RepID=A0ABW3UE17_9GAMM|nr:hypothetical protein [Microbulbifer celer]UFN58897.1 hypothetical protein LPW13_07615 [Microbulbifer celer]
MRVEFLFLLLFSGVSIAEPFHFSIDKPFSSAACLAQAIQAADPKGEWSQDKVGDFAQQLRSIESYSYSSTGERFNCSYDQSRSCIRVEKNILVDVQSISEEVSGRLRSIRKSGCSFYNNDGVRRTVRSKDVYFSTKISGKKRTCMKLPFGGEFKTDLASISGSAWGKVEMLSTDARIENDKVVDGKMTFDVTGDGEVDARVLGIFDLNFINEIGKIAGDALTYSSLGLVKFQINDITGIDEISDVPGFERQWNFGTADSKIDRYDSANLNFLYSGEESRFSERNSKLMVEVNYHSESNEILYEGARNALQKEIDLLNDCR